MSNEKKLKKSKKKFLVLWGNGKAKRELIHVDDLAKACVYFMRIKTSEPFIVPLRIISEKKFNELGDIINQDVQGRLSKDSISISAPVVLESKPNSVLNISSII